MTNYLRTNAIEAVSIKVLTEWNRSIWSAAPQAIPIEEIMETHYRLNIDYCYITNNGRVLGKTIFDDGITPYYDMDNHEYQFMPVKAGTVIIDATLLEDKEGRLRFTLAHELGHWLLHKHLFQGSGTSPANLSKEQDTLAERQANQIAVYLLMPKGIVKKAYFAHQATSKGTITEKLADIFDVSRQAMAIRLKECGLVSE